MLKVSYSVASTANPEPKKLRDEEKKRKNINKQTERKERTNKNTKAKHTIKFSTRKCMGRVGGGVGRYRVWVWWVNLANWSVLLWVSRKGAFFTKSEKVLKWKYYSYHYCFLLLVMPQFKRNNYILVRSGGVGGGIHKTNSWSNSKEHSWVEWLRT